MHLEIAKGLVRLHNTTVLVPLRIRQTPATRFPAGLAQEGRHGPPVPVYPHEPEIRILLPVPVRRQCGQASKARFTLKQRGLGFDKMRDIGKRHHHAAIGQRRGLDLKRQAVGCLVQDPVDATFLDDAVDNVGLCRRVQPFKVVAEIAAACLVTDQVAPAGL